MVSLDSVPALSLSGWWHCHCRPGARPAGAGTGLTARCAARILCPQLLRGRRQRRVRACVRTRVGGDRAAMVRGVGFFCWCGGAGADLWRAARSRSRIWAGVRPRRAAARRRSTARRCSGERSSSRAGISGFSGPGTPGSAHTAHDEAPHGIGSEPAGPARPGMRERGDWSLGAGRGGDRMSLSVPMGPPARPPPQTRRSPPARPATRRGVGVRARHGGAQ